MTTTQVFTTLISLLTGLLGMPIVQWLKTAWKLDNNKALALSSAVAAILGIVSLFVQGQIQLSDFTFENFAGAFGLIYTASNIFFRLLKGEKGQLKNPFK